MTIDATGVSENELGSLSACLVEGAIAQPRGALSVPLRTVPISRDYPIALAGQLHTKGLRRNHLQKSQGRSTALHLGIRMEFPRASIQLGELLLHLRRTVWNCGNVC
jgi:hypothetical protein